MSGYETTPTNHDNEPQVEVIGDEMKAISLDVDRIKIKRVCIISIDSNYTIEAKHGDGSSISTGETNQPHTVLYPHDAEQVLKELDPDISVQTIHLIPNVRQSIATIRRLKHDIDVFINLYDNADDTGVKIIEYMQNQGIAFTGVGLHFYDPTRIELKRLCRYYQLPTPKFALVTSLNNQNDNDLNQISEKLGGFPLFVKPEHGYDSVGIDEKSLVHNLADLKKRCSKVIDEFGAALVEEYIDGREFTVLVAGAGDTVHVFPPVEYHFPVGKSFITFEDKWGTHYSGSHWRLLDETNEEEYHRLTEDLISFAKTLYEAFNGDGYARIDIRQDNKTKQLSILDCNPNCSVFYKDLCSADCIMEFSGWSKPKFMEFLLQQALERQRQYHLKRSYTVKYSPQNGFAIYASRPLREGDLIYTNENCSFKLITKKHAEQTFNKKEIEAFKAFAWPICDNVYVLWHEDSAKWQPINHSCNPNIWMDGLRCIARRAIGAGEEITIDYSTYINTPPTFECWCGASECRRQLKPDEYKEKWFQDRYGSYVSPYILMLIEIDKMKATLH